MQGFVVNLTGAAREIISAPPGLNSYPDNPLHSKSPNGDRIALSPLGDLL